MESTAELLSQKIRVRVAQLRGTFSPAPQSSFFWVLCINGLHLSWGTALSEQAEDEEFPGPLSRDELLECAHYIVSSPGLPLLSIIESVLGKQAARQWSFHHACTVNLMQWFPVMAVFRRSQIAMLNLHEMVLDEHIVDDLLHLDCSPPLAQPTRPGLRL